MSPRTRKPPDRRVDRHKDRGGLEIVPGEALEVPRPPSTWLVSTRRDWQELWESDLAAAYVPTDRPELERYFGLRDERTRLERIARRQMFQVGSKGQLTISPWVRRIAAIDGELDRLADRFGLTPRARLTLGITAATATERVEALFGLPEVPDDDVRPDPRLDALEDES